MFRRAVLFVSFPVLLAAQGVISTIAGTGQVGFSGNDGPAINAVFNFPAYVAVDAAGTIYISDTSTRRIRKIDPATGIISAFAGDGGNGFRGDGGPATNASFQSVAGMCFDQSGNAYVTDPDGDRIRRVDRSGVITTFAGTNFNDSFGDNGPANMAAINEPIGCAFEATGVMYVAENTAHRIRRIDTNGIITTVAGNGTPGLSGDGSPAASAVIRYPRSVAVDYQGNVYFSQPNDHRIRRIDPNGIITNFAGTTQGFDGDNGPATLAQLNFPGKLAVDQAGNVYVNDTGNRRIRQIGRDGIIRTLAGTGTQGFSGDGGPATSAAIGRDVGMAIDATGAMYLADAANNRIRRISPRAPQSPPEFTSAAVVNAASFASGLVPGALATIFGRNLSPASGAVVTSQVPWPARLNGVAVSVGGMPARLYSQATIAGQEQISFQVPFEVASSGNVPVVVENNGATSTSVSVPVRAAMPGVFLIDGSNGAFLHANFSPVTPANPAMRGEVLLLYLTGLGAVSPAVATGTPGPASEPLARTTATPVVTIGGQIADVLYSGIAPGFVGLYQLNLRVPATAPSGAVDIEVRVGETAGNAAKLQVQ